eukprot:978190-Pelagomonas_calceolata.AAC.1
MLCQQGWHGGLGLAAVAPAAAVSAGGGAGGSRRQCEEHCHKLPVLAGGHWPVLRECHQEPLQFYWSRATSKLFNSTDSRRSTNWKEAGALSPQEMNDWFGYRHVLLQLSCPRRQ